ncbi:hypothetical protein [Shewanella fodinae]|uniref:hypothetical protein n=1 Tax=Shewanella fodinae TaxID=552357 RepID=UPI00167330C4|nr:hypothetical protein [Shewanella fodinae]MCL2905194.1 hypothetical protein [Shewanella fodinae]GGY87871.1 hypothetical protein GCM10007169_01300 [Shewanella fodinae]
MYYGYLEEGDKCPECKKGILDWKNPDKEIRDRGCSCHISPPCSYCTGQVLHCDECGWFDDDVNDESYVPVAPGLSMLVHKPKPLDNTKIDYRCKMHSSSSMIKEGVYPEGATMEEVRKEVNGTFGGRFEFFEGGRFKFIAYTD